MACSQSDVDLPNRVLKSTPALTGLETDARGMQTWYNSNNLRECFEPLYQPDENSPLVQFERDLGPLRDRILSQRRKWYEF